eukprot:877859-Rhodomonas_salina.2
MNHAHAHAHAHALQRHQSTRTQHLRLASGIVVTRITRHQKTRCRSSTLAAVLVSDRSPQNSLGSPPTSRAVMR